MHNEEDFESLEIVVRDPSNLPTPKAETLDKWTRDRLAEDAVDLYTDLRKALKSHLKPRKDKDGNPVLPNLKALELAADILKLRDQGGININQNFGGNTTIHNNGPSVSFEDLVRRQQARVSPDETIIEAEIIEEEKKA
jgi:hypothetical protein